MSNVLFNMLSALSDADKKSFEDLSKRLKVVKGEISLLSKDDLKLIESMEKRYGDKIRNVKHNTSEKNNSTKAELLDTPFAIQVRQIIARDLGAKYPLEEDALTFVFENKWVPVDCQDKALVEDLYQRFETDINEANQWREELGDVVTDKAMAVGLAWFMVVYQLYKRLNS